MWDLKTLDRMNREEVARQRAERERADLAALTATLGLLVQLLGESESDPERYDPHVLPDPTT